MVDKESSDNLGSNEDEISDSDDRVQKDKRNRKREQDDE